MMHKEKNDILNFLINIYERSKCFKDDIQTSNRILMTFNGKGKNIFEKYDIENSDCRISFNNACIELKKEDLIDFDWLKGSENHILHKAWLKRESIEQAYSFINRKPKSEYISMIINLVDEAISECYKNSWVHNCLLKWRENIENKQKVGSFLPTDICDIEEYLKVICAVSKLGNSEILERVFSTKVLGDSKKFEKLYKNRFVSLLKKTVCDEYEIDSTTPSEILSIVGIVKYPEQISFCGDLYLTLNNETVIGFSSLVNGAYINAKDVDMFDFKIGEEVTKIITIENLANYYNYISTQQKSDELVIYHGGYYSPSKGKFFKKIANSANAEILFFHWGDIDFGGFSMLKRLRVEIISSYQPLFMGKKDLLKFKSSTLSFDEKYESKLKSLLQYDILVDCYECIEYMIENKVRLEQEAMIPV